MSRQNILLAIDGSRESLAAVSAALALTEKRKAALTAISVVDTKHLWALLNCGNHGLIGSGPYFDAFEKVKSAFRSISDALMTSFEARAHNCEPPAQFLTVEGDPVIELAERSRNFDLVVTGRRHNLYSSQNCRYYRYSLTQRLALICSAPLLIIGSDAAIKQARLLIDTETFDSSIVLEFVAFALQSKFRAEIFCVGQTGQEKLLLQKVVELVPSSVSVQYPDESEGDSPFEIAVDVGSDTLLVLPTKQIFERRSVPGGMLAPDFLAMPSSSSLLILPPRGLDSQEVNASQNEESGKQLSRR